MLRPWTIWATLLATSVVGLASAPGPAVAPGPPVHFFSGSFASADTGTIQVNVPSPTPEVRLVQDANASVAAMLQLSAVAEVDGVLNSSPYSYALAIVQAPSSYSATGTLSPSSSIALSANLPVVSNSAPLGGPPVPGPGGNQMPLGQAQVSFHLSLRPATTASTTAVVIGWTIAGWPWMSPGDRLALVFDFDAAGAIFLSDCQTPSQVLEVIPECQGVPVSVGNSGFLTGMTALEAENSSGAVAALTWDSTASADGIPVAVSPGIWTQGDGDARLILALPNGSINTAQGAVTIALAAPSPLPAFVPPRADVWILGGASAGLVAVAAIAVVLYRRRERSIRESL